MSSAAPWSRRLVVVCGKGGVGRSTVAACAALAAAQSGRRTALVEVHGARSQAAFWGAAPPPGRPARLADGLDLFCLSPAACVGAYVTHRRAIAPLAGAVLGSQLVSGLLDALPGFGDLVHLGMTRGLLDEKVGSVGPYDTVVIDAPPTGHGLALTATARVMAEMTGEGPIHDECVEIAERLEDPVHTAQVWVSLPEALPASETVQALAALGAQAPTAAGLVLNRWLDDPFGDEAVWPTLRPALRASGPGWVGVGDRLEARLSAARRAARALHEGAGERPVWRLPELGGPLSPAALPALVAAWAGEVGR